MNASDNFPQLTPDNHRETSPRTKAYNCIAWAAEDTEHWWEPGGYWRLPDWDADDHGIAALEQAFGTLGYQDCGVDDTLEVGFLKVALYARGGSLWTHASRQLPSGKWTSKLGGGIDIEHDTLDVVAEGLYGHVLQVMKRAVTSL